MENEPSPILQKVYTFLYKQTFTLMRTHRKGKFYITFKKKKKKEPVLEENKKIHHFC